MNKLLRALLVALVGTGMVLIAVYRQHLDVAALEAWIAAAGPAGSLLFILIYAIGTVLFFPGAILTLAGGVLFGPVLGSFLNLTGATLGATLAFLIARYLASQWVEHRAGGRLKQLKQGVEAEGWRFVAFVRLVPLFPFNVLNYALGLTRIRLSHYVVASYIFMLPGAIAYTYLGYAGKEAVAGGEGMIQKGLLALALLAAVSFLPRLIGRLRRGAMLDVGGLKNMLDDHRDVMVLDVRTAQECTGDEGRIAGSTNIPVEELAGRVHELADYTERPVVIVCHTDRRSLKAARMLSARGFADVHVVKGGMRAWNAAGFPVAR
jgi:uncharacterized membrane protein YdjX (TVP38/TMEM64 family)/rhodanese-related sulfurtransferase